MMDRARRSYEIAECMCKIILQRVGVRREDTPSHPTEEQLHVFAVKLSCIKQSPVYNGRGHPLDFLNPQVHCFYLYMTVTKLGYN